MIENIMRKMNSDEIKCLSLRFVNRDSKGWSQGELMSRKSESQAFGGFECDSRYADFAIVMDTLDLHFSGQIFLFWR